MRIHRHHLSLLQFYRVPSEMHIVGLAITVLTLGGCPDQCCSASQLLARIRLMPCVHGFIDPEELSDAGLNTCAPNASNRREFCLQAVA